MSEPKSYRELQQDIYNAADAMKVAGQALEERDCETLENVQRIVANWMQTDEEADGFEVALQAMLEACYELESYEAN